MEGWEVQATSFLDGDYTFKIYVLEKKPKGWFVCSELVDVWLGIKIGKRTGRKHINWAGHALYLDEVAEIGEPRNKVRKFTYARKNREDSIYG